MPGTRLAVATLVLGMLEPGAEMAVAAMLVAAVLMPGVVGAVAVATMLAVMVELVPVAAVAMAAVVVRSEDEGVPGKLVPVAVPAGMAAGMRPLVARTRSLRIVQHPVEGSRGNPEENRLAGGKVMSALPGVTLSIRGERRLDAERGHREHREQRRER